jgi:hypothetical protein
MNIWCFEEARLVEALKEEGNRLLAAGVPTAQATEFVNGVRNFLRGDIARQHKLIVESREGGHAG